MDSQGTLTERLETLHISMDNEIPLQACAQPMIIYPDQFTGIQPDVTHLVKYVTDPYIVLSMDNAVITYRTIKQIYDKVYTKFLVDEIVAMIVCELNNHLFDWNLLQNPLHPIPVFRNLQYLLGNENCDNGINAFDTVIWNSLNLYIEKAFKDWNGEDSKEVVRFLSTWFNLIPKYITEYIFPSLVIPKLSFRVLQLNSYHNNDAIANTIFPWIDKFQKFIEPEIFPLITYKLTSLIEGLESALISGRRILEAWRNILPLEVICDLVDSLIYPKLWKALSDYFLDIQGVFVTNFNTIVAWRDLISFEQYHLLRKVINNMVQYKRRCPVSYRNWLIWYNNPNTTMRVNSADYIAWYRTFN